MEIQLYKSSSEKNAISKSLSNTAVLNGHLVGSSNVVSPTITIGCNTSYFTYNYCYIPDFGRYYYIMDMEVDGKTIILKLHCDVLMTFREQILNSTCRVVRSNKGSKWVKDPMVVTTSELEWQARKIGSGFPLKNSYVLQVGGKSYTAPTD